MQTKISYGVVKWMFLAGMTCSLASACIVSSGDGIDDDTPFDDGGDGGTTPSGGKSGSGGGGKSGSGGTAGSKSDGGMPNTVDGGEPGAGGGGMPSSTFVPGECQTTNDPLQPTLLPVCDDAAGDNACIECLKLQACDEFKTCFGEAPATACSVGMTEGADGQFECVRKCFAEGADDALDADMLLSDCSATCDECGTGGLNDETSDLIVEANNPDKCQAECFPFN
jgi:hypothetical protein